MNSTRLSRYRAFAWGALAYNVATSAWGAFVRATGSGAGCGEHWPDCNGEVVPRAPRLETIIEFTHRLTSGLALLVVVALVVGAFWLYPRRHPVRFAAATSLGFVLSEALVGAALVIFGLVKDNASPVRAVVMGVHLVNTFLLLAALAVTAALASEAVDFTGRRRSGSSGRGAVLWALAAPVVMLILSGLTGAVAALGDTLFHASSLAQGLQQDSAATAHVFVRLRA
ncbi:MAG TPA: COX15/CtaA family protein, partial [Polyangiaceae bacterium]